MDDFQVDVLVVGAGNAAACAALAAREQGASVAMLEAAPEEERGGNSTYTAGAMRVVFHGVDDLAQLYDLTEDEKRDVDFGSYSADQFLDDMGRVTNYRCDPRAHRHPDRPQLRDAEVDAQQGRALPADPTAARPSR